MISTELPITVGEIIEEIKTGEDTRRNKSVQGSTPRCRDDGHSLEREIDGSNTQAVIQPLNTTAFRAVLIPRTVLQRTSCQPSDHHLNLNHDSYKYLVDDYLITRPKETRIWGLKGTPLFSFAFPVLTLPPLSYPKRQLPNLI